MNIIQSIDVDEEDGYHYFAMEYVQGPTVDDLLQKTPILKEDFCLDIICQTARAIQAAEKLSIVHFDIKPSNIMITRDRVAKLADFGLARRVDQSATRAKQALVFGTPEYMSPEQALGKPDVDSRSDIYSLGATFYRMVVGDLPFKGQTPLSVMHKIATETVPDPLTQMPELSPEVGAVICKMMAKQREHRYQSMGDVINHLEALRAGQQTGLEYKKTTSLLWADSVSATGLTTPIRLPRRRVKILIGAATAAVLLLVLGIALFWPDSRSSPQATDEPEHAAPSQDGTRSPTVEDVVSMPPSELDAEQGAASATDEVLPAGIRRPENALEGMTRIPAGRFPLGLRYSGLVTLTPPCAPEHRVVLDAFAVDVHEVTNAEYQKFVDGGGYTRDACWIDSKGVDRGAFMDATGAAAPAFWRHGRHPKGQGRLPVVGVSWYEAAAYARWAGKTLPTEAQWECAALALMPPDESGQFSKQAFPWGKTYRPRYANLKDAGKNQIRPVGSFPNDESPAGCRDMVGNVREWTASEFDPYPGSEQTHKEFGKGLAVVRGAAYIDSMIDAKVTTRRPRSRHTRDAVTGFRCIRELQ